MAYLLLFYCLFGLVSGQCLEDQRSLLLQLKQDLSITNSSTVSKLSSWRSKENCCSWDGVSCEPQTGHVIGLDLSSSSISGGINGSSSLFSLRHLRRLNLANNSFYSSPFPSGFDRLSSLTHLNLSFSGFFGQVPLEISFLKMLVSLDLSNYFGSLMKLENPDFKTLVKNLTNLKVLRLDGVNISSNEWSQTLSSALPNLRELSLSLCNLVGPIHPSLSQLRFLTHLNLGGNNLTSVVPDFFQNFSSLMSLQLSGCFLYGRFSENVLLMPTLHTLDISDNPLLTGSLPQFPQGGALQVINLDNTKFSGKLPDSIDNLVFLMKLVLSRCGFFGSIPSSFENIPGLVYLDLSRNNFSGRIPSLASSKNITELILSHNRFTGTIPLSFGNELMNLETLNLRNNSLQGSIPSSLFTIPSIKRVLLGRNRLNGKLQEFENTSSSSLREINLGQNELNGTIPMWVFKIRALNVLVLSSNRFSGTINLGMFKDLMDLSVLDLSDNDMTCNTSGSNSTTFPQIGRPDFLEKPKRFVSSRPFQ